MNLNQIYAGNDYAYSTSYKTRGQKFVSSARRVRAVKAFKKVEYFNTKATGFVEVLRVDKDGNATSNEPFTVRARDLLCTWEEHEDEMERRASKLRAAQVEQERIKREREREIEEFYSRLDELNIPKHEVTLHGGYVYVSKSRFLEMLNGLRETSSQKRDNQSAAFVEGSRSI